MAQIKVERGLHLGTPYTPDMQDGGKRAEPTWSTIRDQVRDAGSLGYDAILAVETQHDPYLELAVAAQEPSKLGVEPGDTISVEDAIKAVVTRSANDVAVAIAEAIGRDEDTFAEMMTRKAQALGMASTVYRNASGLPDPDQYTTARDEAQLALALYRDFPREYRFFSTREFYFRGKTIHNHNHLLD